MREDTVVFEECCCCTSLSARNGAWDAQTVWSVVENEVVVSLLQRPPISIFGNLAFQHDFGYAVFMLCPRCMSVSRVTQTRWMANYARVCVFAPQSLVVWRLRLCKNRKCKHRWPTVELGIADIEARAAEIQATMAETLQAAEDQCPE